MVWLALVAKQALRDSINPARAKCQYDPAQDCTCAGVRGEHVYACECCAASPCRPQADLKLDKILKAEREKGKEDHAKRKQHKAENEEHP